MKTPKLVSLLRAAPALAAACALFSGGGALAQPTITSIYPDGSVQFQASSKLSFVAAAPAGVTNISVQLNGTRMNGATLFQLYTSAVGLTINNGTNVSAPLLANIVYTAAIVATDANGVATTANVSFDTITPAYTWEAEDWDYDGGKFIDNPQTNAYANLVGVAGTDATNITTAVGLSYRPASYGNLGTEVNGDKPRVQYKSSGLSDYDVGWNNKGDWANYTRHFPAGSWNLFMRGANPGASQALGSPGATATIGGGGGLFALPGTGGWQNYTWVPMTDSSGNLVEWDADGTQQTVLISTVNGSYNANFYMLLPVTAPETSDATVQNPYPDGTIQFQATNTFAFTVTSSLGVSAANILVDLTATTLAGAGSSTVLVPGDGLTVAGPAGNLVVSTPVTTNLVYTAFIQITDAHGVMTTTNIAFDTIIPAYTWEAEDWDYTTTNAPVLSAQFFDNPQVDSYNGLFGTAGIDYGLPSPVSGSGNGYNRVPGLATEGNGDVPRQDHAGYSDYDVGWTAGGQWMNYTRDWPAGVYNVYVRIANGSGAATTDSGSLSLVTSGVGTSNQVLSKLGSYASPTTAGWQKYHWVPIIDAGGNLVRFTGGSKQTLRNTIDGADDNLNFFLLMPVDPNARPVPFVSNLYPEGAAVMFQRTNLMTFTVNSAPGISTNDIGLTLNGAKASHMTFNGTPNNWSVTCPVALDEFYTAVFTLTDSYGTSTYTTSFATFSSSYYTFEAEDFDYSGGQFINNPAPDAYSGFTGQGGVDATNTVSGTTSAYRPADVGNLSTEGTGDTARTQFTSASATDYDVGYNNGGSGDWGNYTRNYPAGVYNIYMRAANPNGATADGASLWLVTSGVGTSSQTTVKLGSFSIPATGAWQTYSWAPLTDALGRIVQITNSGAATTLRVDTDNGSYNANFYILVPADTSRPVLSQFYPDGSTWFQKTNTLSFVASSTAGIDPSSAKVTLNGVAASGLVFSGPPTNLTVSCSIPQPGLYTVVVSVNSLNNDPATATYSFDTFSASYYTFEAEDYDYNGGQFYDNPQTNAYAGLLATDGVDAHNTTGGAASYRPINSTTGDLGNEVNGDLQRAQYTSAGLSDYDIGWTSSGNWANYTRTYPTGSFNVFLRGSSPGGQTDGASLLRVTSGLGTTNQATTPLGKFNFPATGGYQAYTWLPLVDSAGNAVTITNSGAVSTFRLNEDNSGWNANFLMLVPVAPGAPKLTFAPAGSNLTITWAPAGGRLESSPVLGANANWQPVGTANPAVIPITGQAQYFRVINP